MTRPTDENIDRPGYLTGWETYQKGKEINVEAMAGLASTLLTGELQDEWRAAFKANFKAGYFDRKAQEEGPANG